MQTINKLGLIRGDMVAIGTMVGVAASVAVLAAKVAHRSFRARMEAV